MLQSGGIALPQSGRLNVVVNVSVAWPGRLSGSEARPYLLFDRLALVKSSRRVLLLALLLLYSPLLALAKLASANHIV